MERDEVLKALKTAIEAEFIGHHFYKNAAQNVSDPRAKEAFESLAQEEIGHFNYLRKQYKSVLEKGDYDFSESIERSGSHSAESPIFSQEIKNRIKDAHFEVSVLTIAMKLEQDAVAFYKGMAEKAENEEARALYEQLAQWEQGHYDAFARELEALKEDYWTANSFVPM